jgi:hypothetical protein
MPTTDADEFTAEDLERLYDRIRHAEQYLRESLEAVGEAIELAEKAEWDKVKD